MRPRLKIALYCLDETRRSVMAFALETRLPVEIICPQTQADLISLLACHECESGNNDVRCVIVVHADSKHDTQTILYRLNQQFDVPTILIGTWDQTARPIFATRVFPPSVETAELVDALKTVTARKRGPKKHDGERQAMARQVGRNAAMKASA